MPKRTAPRASFSVRPNARITYDGSMELEVHAEPLENATSGMADINLSLSILEKLIFKFPGRRASMSPCTTMFCADALMRW